MLNSRAWLQKYLPLIREAKISSADLSVQSVVEEDSEDSGEELQVAGGSSPGEAHIRVGSPRGERKPPSDQSKIAKRGRTLSTAISIGSLNNEYQPEADPTNSLSSFQAENPGTLLEEENDDWLELGEGFNWDTSSSDEEEPADRLGIPSKDSSRRSSVHLDTESTASRYSNLKVIPTDHSTDKRLLRCCSDSSGSFLPLGTVAGCTKPHSGGA